MKQLLNTSARLNQTPGACPVGMYLCKKTHLYLRSNDMQLFPELWEIAEKSTSVSEIEIASLPCMISLDAVKGMQIHKLMPQKHTIYDETNYKMASNNQAYIW